jgi:hypothetical protein
VRDLVGRDKPVKCYEKRFEYKIPEPSCEFCNDPILQGEGLYSVSLEWGNSKRACKKCYDKFEVDESLHLPPEGVCEKCYGSGWVWWYELDEYHGPANDPHDCYGDDTKYTCDKCEG